MLPWLGVIQGGGQGHTQARGTSSTSEAAADPIYQPTTPDPCSVPGRRWQQDTGDSEPEKKVPLNVERPCTKNWTNLGVVTIRMKKSKCWVLHLEQSNGVHM